MEEELEASVLRAAPVVRGLQPAMTHGSPLHGGSSGSGNGTVSYSVAANNTPQWPRTGTITIAGQTFTSLSIRALTAGMAIALANPVRRVCRIAPRPAICSAWGHAPYAGYPVEYAPSIADAISV